VLQKRDAHIVGYYVPAAVGMLRGQPGALGPGPSESA
jgi:hypothetical protein